MADVPLGAVLRRLRRQAVVEQTATLADAELLDHFVLTQDGLAFEVLFWRHAPLVLAVCRRLLPGRLK